MEWLWPYFMEQLTLFYWTTKSDKCDLQLYTSDMWVLLQNWKTKTIQ